MAGLAALLGSTFMLCFGRTEAVLIVARVFQGISAAVVWTVGLALIVDTVGEARVGQAMAYASSAMSMGLILGPVLGGVLYDKRGYYAAFALAFALIGFDLVLRVILVEKKIAVRYENIESSTPRESPQSIKLQPIQPVQPPETNEISTRAPSPILSVRESRIPPVLRILKFPRLLVALFLSFVQALILSAFDATLPLYLNALFKFTALEAGLSSF
jgi:MFS family permease